METTEQPQSTQSIKMEETVDQPNNQQVGQDPIMPESTNITDSKPNKKCCRLNIVLISVNVMLMLLLTVCIALVMYRQHTMHSEHEDLEKLVNSNQQQTFEKIKKSVAELSSSQDELLQKLNNTEERQMANVVNLKQELIDEIRHLKSELQTKINNIDINSRNLNGTMEKIRSPGDSSGNAVGTFANIQIEQGEVDCSGADGWDKGLWGYKYHTVYFARYYSKPPMVHVSVKDYLAETSEMFVRLSAHTLDVKNNHMRIVCFKDRLAGTIRGMRAIWISFAQ